MGQEWGQHGYPRIIYNYVAVGCDMHVGPIDLIFFKYPRHRNKNPRFIVPRALESKYLGQYSQVEGFFLGGILFYFLFYEMLR